MTALRVLVIDEIPGRAAMLEQALRDEGYEVLRHEQNDANLVQQVQDLEPDLVLMDLESPDRDVLEHIASVSRNQPRPIVMFSEESDQKTIERAISSGVSAYVVDGLNPERLDSIMSVAIARFREFQALRDELDKTKTQLSERKVVDRAKGLLMEKKGLSENEAYQLLRSNAMNQGKKLVEVAQSLIDAMEMLDL